MPRTAATKPGRLSDLARHVILPTGIVSTGWPAVRDQLADWGIVLDEWQDGAGRAILAKRDDGVYAATVGGIVLCIPRQVAKTWLVGRIIVALCVLFPGLKVLWTAHRTRTSTNTFRSLQGFCRTKKVSPHVAHIRTANGEQEIGFHNGSVIMFGAREQGFGRGFDEVDIEVFDEAQILTEKALEDMVAATNQSRHPHGALLFYMCTPPRPVDPGEAITVKRSKALKGKSEDTLLIEFSADPDAKPDDRDQWAKANPSYPHRTPLESMLRMRENLPSDEAWLREALGIWDGDEVVDVFGAGRWRRCTVGDGVELPDAPAAIGIAVSLDRTSASIASAALLEPDDGTEPDDEDDVPVFVAGVDQRPEVDWLIGEVKRIQDTHDCAVLADSKGPVADMREDFEDADVDVTWVSLEEYVAACSDLYDRVRKGPVRLLHPGSGDGEVSWLDAAVRGADWRSVGDGRRVWGRKKSASDVAMLEAATFAVRGAELSGVGIW